MSQEPQQMKVQQPAARELSAAAPAAAPIAPTAPADGNGAAPSPPAAAPGNMNSTRPAAPQPALASPAAAPLPHPPVTGRAGRRGDPTRWIVAGYVAGALGFALIFIVPRFKSPWATRGLVLGCTALLAIGAAMVVLGFVRRTIRQRSDSPGAGRIEPPR